MISNNQKLLRLNCYTYKVS